MCQEVCGTMVHRLMKFMASWNLEYTPVPDLKYKQFSIKSVTLAYVSGNEQKTDNVYENINP